MTLRTAWITLALVVGSTLTGLMGTDLVLPAVPHLPEALGGSAAMAQLVLAAYVAGGCGGLLLFGALGQRVSTHHLFVGSLAATALFSLGCGLANRIDLLVLLRLLHGAASVGPAVFAPAIIKALFDETRAVRAIGLLGSIEALVPAFAPMLGALLFTLGGWRLSFVVVAALAGALALVLALLHVPQVSRRAQGSYGRLLRDPVYLRYMLSQSFVLGALLTFVFGMPTAFVRVLGGTLGDFILMQVLGIGSFIFAANNAARWAGRYGAERLIGLGSGLALAAAAAQFGYALAGGGNPLVIAALFLPVNLGMGLRGPPGLYRVIAAAHGDDARGSALVVLGIFAVTALGAATAAPWIETGSAPLAGIACALHLVGVLSLALLPRLETEAPGHRIGNSAGEEQAG